MTERYGEFALIYKALADETRLKIIDMLSCGELCACKILEAFNITQPTLSYHMKVLMDSGIVIGQRNGAWMNYNIDQAMVDKLASFWQVITSDKADCICREGVNT